MPSAFIMTPPLRKDDAPRRRHPWLLGLAIKAIWCDDPVPNGETAFQTFGLLGATFMYRVRTVEYCLKPEAGSQSNMYVQVQKGTCSNVLATSSESTATELFFITNARN